MFVCLVWLVPTDGINSGYQSAKKLQKTKDGYDIKCNAYISDSFLYILYIILNVLNWYSQLIDQVRIQPYVTWID